MPAINRPDNSGSNLQSQAEAQEETSVGKQKGQTVSKVPGENTAGLEPRSQEAPALSRRTLQEVEAKTFLRSSRLTDSSGAQRLDSRSEKSLSLLFNTPWMKQRLNRDNPLSEAELDQLCQAAWQLDEQIKTGTPEHTLAWRADSLLGDRIDTSSPILLTRLIRKSFETLKNKAETIGLPKQIEALNQALVHIDEVDAETTSVEKLIALSNILKTVQADAPDIVGSELLSGWRDHLDDQIKGIAREEFTKALGKQLKSLEKGGSQQEYILSFELGAATAHVVGANAGIRFTLDASALNSSLIMDRSTLTGNIDLIIGHNLAVRVDADMSLSAGRGKLFKNLDDFVDFHANDILPVLLGSASKAHKNIKGVIKARQSDSLHARLVADKSKLQQTLIGFGVLNPGDRLIVKDRRRAEYTEVSEKTIAFQAQVNAFEKMLAGSYTLTNKHSEFRRHVAIQDAFRSNPQLLEKEPSRYFSVLTHKQILTGVEGQKWIEATGQLLSQLGEEYLVTVKSDPRKAAVLRGMVEQIRSNLRGAIAALYSEYDHYSAVVNRYDGKDDSSDIHGDLGDIKHKLEKSRGCHGRGEFLRAISATHARLSGIYHDSFIPGLPPTPEDIEAGKLFSCMEAEYRMPQVHLSDKQIKNSLHVKTINRSSQINHAGEIKAKIPNTPLLLSAAVQKEHIEGHFNTDMNGDYLNVSCRLDAGASVQKILGALSSHIGRAAGINSQLIASSLPTNMTYKTYTAGQLECRFVKAEDGYRLQYIRFCGEKGIGGATPEIPVVAGPWGNVNAKIGAAFHHKTNLKEYVGNNTLTYMFTRFNGWANGGKASEDIQTMREAGQSEEAGADYWDRFIHNNEPQIKLALKNMADTKKNITLELNIRLKEIGDSAFSSQFQQALETYSKTPSDENYKAALKDFNEFMARSHQIDKAKTQSAFTMKTGK